MLKKLLTISHGKLRFQYQDLLAHIKQLIVSPIDTVTQAMASFFVLVIGNFKAEFEVYC